MRRLALLSVLLWTSAAAAAPTLTLGPENATVSKGQVVDVWVAVSTDQALDDVEVFLQLPYGFASRFVPVPGTEFDPATGTVLIPKLASQSKVELLFRIQAPSVFGVSASETDQVDGERLGTISTERDKRVVANVRHQTAAGPQQLSAGLDLRYTTVMWLYVLCGVIGISLGHLAKVAGEDREKLVAALPLVVKQGAWYRLGNLLRYVYVDRMPSFVTLLIIGFAALLALSAEGMPVSSWHQSIALGLGLAVVSDDKLLARAKSAVV